MNHLAVDLGSRKSQLCQRSAKGNVLAESKVLTRDLRETFKALTEPNRVVLETSAEAFAVARWAQEAGHDVRVVRSTLAKQLGVGDRGVKTDLRDARVLSKVSCALELESVHVPSTVASELKALCTSRTALVRSRTLLINSVRGYLRTQVLRVPSGKSATFAKRIRQLLEARLEGMPFHIDCQLKGIETLTVQIEECDNELAELAEKDATCVRLMSAPGVGPVTAVLFRATVDEVKRFEDAHHLESYLGLTPGEDSSGETERKLGITHAGSARMRSVLVQAAWSAWRSRPNDPMVEWAKRIALKRNKQVAIVALARKLAGILFALWRDGTMYTPIPHRAH
jgi:transposase